MIAIEDWEMRTFKCIRCGKTTDVDIAAIAEDVRKSIRLLGEQLGGVRINHLLTQVNCKHCGAKIDLKAGDESINSE